VVGMEDGNELFIHCLSAKGRGVSGNKTQGIDIGPGKGTMTTCLKVFLSETNKVLIMSWVVLYTVLTKGMRLNIRSPIRKKKFTRNHCVNIPSHKVKIEEHHQDQQFGSIAQ